MNTLALLAAGSSILSLLCLLLLHFVSPEYRPSWRMISEYALGKHKWLITSFFLLWGISSFLLSLLLWNAVTGTWAKLGVILLLISGIGEVMGGLFDVKHKHHGLAFLLGVPSLPIASLLIGYTVAGPDSLSNYKHLVLISSHATWVSLVLMSLSMGVMFSGLKKAGIEITKNSQPLEYMPEGVIALAGYANRFLVVCYELWLILIATTLL
ncbi:MAG: DUF998 domain-containing protein [Bacteroidia bacterium]|nr:DUF998 domain-containing protein [Bacteroidia bacterium]MBP9180262.1 DUF998 domain-containing protein [Bacteroidia bacterium]